MALRTEINTPLRKLRFYCVLIGCVAIALWSGWTANQQWANKQAQFQDRAARLLNGVATQLTASMAMTRSFQAFFDSSDPVETDAFATFSAAQLKNFPYINSAFYAPRIERDGRVNFEQTLTRQSTHTVISERDNKNVIRTSPARDFYFPVMYLKTVRPSAVYTGLDVYPGWRAPMEEAFASDEVRGLPVSLTPDSIDQCALLIPIYQNDGRVDRHARVVGVVAMLIDKYELVDRMVFGTSLNLRIAFSERSVLDFGAAADATTKSNQGWFAPHIAQLRGPVLSGNQSIHLLVQQPLQWELDDLIALLVPLFGGIALTFGCYWALRGHFLASVAEAGSRAKGEFLTVMSHEIRTPLNGVLGMTDLLEKTPLKDEQRGYVAAIRSAGNSLLEIINDILDMSKIEARRMRLEEIDFDLGRVVADIADVYRVSFFSRSILFDASLGPTVPEIVRGDPTRLRQILNNLLSNALKFTARGTVSLRIEKKSTDGVNNLLRFEIADTGVGIAPDHLQRVFDAFTDVADWSRRRYSGTGTGTGLGLSICKQLIDMMGGKIGVDSAPDHGSRFWFELALPSQPVSIDSTRSPLRNWRTLIVAAEEGALAIDVEQTRTLGMKPITAPDLQQAWAWLEASASAPPELIVLDLPESEKACADFCARLSVDLRFQRIPVLVYTVNPPEVPPRNAHCAGVKPVSAARLLRIVERDPTHETAAGGTMVELEQPLNILVAEDNLVNIAVLKSMLKQLGHRSTFCENGDAALTAFCHASRRFDLILMDCEMPVLDGFSATRAMRTFEHQEGLLPTPIIALTAHAFPEQQEQCLEAGMDRYLSKPVSLATLTSTLRQYQRSTSTERKTQ